MAAHVIEVAVTGSNGETTYEEETIRTDLTGSEWTWQHVLGKRAPKTRVAHGPFQTEEDAIGDACKTIGGSWAP